MMKWVIMLVISFSAFGASAQKVDSLRAKVNLYDGNQAYAKADVAQAKEKYQAALAANPNYAQAHYNYANTLYHAKAFDSARASYEIAEKLTKDQPLLAMTEHNIGNTWLSQKKWSEAIEAYKKSLRIRPNNYDTKYNLAYAQKMLQKDKDKNKDKDKEKDKKDQDKKEQDKKDQEKKDQDKKDQDKKNQEPQKQPSKLTQDQAKQILDAMRENEKKLQQDKNKEKGLPTRLEKDW